MKGKAENNQVILYTDEKALMIVERGQHYATPDDTKVFEGSTEEFRKEHPNINTDNIEYDEDLD